MAPLRPRGPRAGRTAGGLTGSAGAAGSRCAKAAARRRPPRATAGTALYEASLAWAPAGRPFCGGPGAWARTLLEPGLPGRRAGPASVRRRRSRWAGSRDGRGRRRRWRRSTAAAKYGGFVRFAPGRAGAYELVVSGRRRSPAARSAGEYLAQEGHLRSGRLWIHERVEVDLYRDWREERAGTGAQLSDARVQASWRSSPTRSLTVAYERRRNFWTAFNRLPRGHCSTTASTRTSAPTWTFSRAGRLGALAGRVAAHAGGRRQTGSTPRTAALAPRASSPWPASAEASALPDR